MKKTLFLCFAIFLSITVLRAQEKTITGKVISSDDSTPIPGVNIMEKGTVNGAVTNLDGEYSISISSPDAVLVFSFIGYLKEEIPVDGQSTIDLTLVPDIAELDEVVVIGYGTAKKRDIIGSVAKVSGDDLTEFATPNIGTALQGTASGLQVASSSGTPGAVSRIMIRGTNSISSATEPLWVIDGIIMGSNLSNGTNIGQSGGSTTSILSTLNPNDIESIEVLKDAAATAIYGQRGSNGVIIVTTKTGKKGISESNISYSQGITDLTKHPGDLGFANSTQWFDIMETARANSGLDPVEYDPVVHGNVNSIDNSVTLSRAQALATQTDWYDQIVRKGSFKEVNFSTSNGTERGSYYISANYRNDESVIKNEYLDRFSVRSNMNFDLTDNLKLESRLNFSYLNNVTRPDGGAPGGNNNTARGGFKQAMDTPPWMPVYDPDNPTELWNTLSGYNLVASNDPDNIRSEGFKYRMIGGAAATYTLPWIDGLSIRGEASIDYINDHSIFWANTIVRRGSSYAFDDKGENRLITYNLYGTYDKTFGDHNIVLVAGTESELTTTKRTYIEGDELSGTAQQAGGPANPIRIGAGFGGERYLRGMFGRANYKLLDRYLLGVSFRRDGTSALIEENRWGTFTALSAGWILSDESFMQNLTVLNFLKLRGSFGQTGNANIPGGIDVPQYLDWMRYGQRDLGIANGTAFSGFATRDISWETTSSYDVGIDFGILENRINGSLAYYYQNVSDMLLQVPVPPSAGMFSFGNNGTIWKNIGDMKNFGIEFNVSTVNVITKDFKWTSSFNLTTNKNEILKLNPELDDTGTGLIINEETYSRTGGSLGEWYLNEFAGIDHEHGYPLIYQADRDRFIKDDQGNDTEELNPNYLQRYVDPETGEYVVIPATRSNTDNNRIIHEGKTGMPTYFGGFSNVLSYKGFDFSFTFTFAGGNYVYDEVADKLHAVGGNMVSDLKEISWSENNKNVSYPELSTTARYDIYDADGNLASSNQRFDNRRLIDQHLVKGDYIRLRTVRLNYNFGQNIAETLKLKGLSAYIAANNLWTWTAEYEGLDPEGANLDGSAQNRNLNQGKLGAGLPNLKSFYFGVNVKF